jgi:hypothetical protein
LLYAVTGENAGPVAPANRAAVQAVPTLDAHAGIRWRQLLVIAQALPCAITISS